MNELLTCLGAEEMPVATQMDIHSEFDVLLAIVKSVRDRLTGTDWEEAMPKEVRRELWVDGLTLGLVVERAERLLREGRKLSAMNATEKGR